MKTWGRYFFFAALFLAPPFFAAPLLLDLDPPLLDFFAGTLASLSPAA
jgi:hypothetical protein